jgi:hypothetical protein
LDFIHHPFGHPPGLRMTLFRQTVFVIGQQQALIIVRAELLSVANQIDVCHKLWRRL